LSKNDCRVPAGSSAGGEYCSPGGGGGGNRIIDRQGTTYTVKDVNFVDRKGNPRRRFKVYEEGKETAIGNALLSRSGRGIDEVTVDPAFQRRGIATALYSHIESIVGHKLAPTSTRTLPGQALWASRTRNK
jgi:GNAT superfamily N-acetyltransferase